MGRTITITLKHDIITGPTVIEIEMPEQTLYAERRYDKTLNAAKEHVVKSFKRMQHK